MKRRAEIEARLVLARLLSLARGWEGRGRRGCHGGEATEVAFDRHIVRGKLLLTRGDELEILLQDKSDSPTIDSEASCERRKALATGPPRVHDDPRILLGPIRA